MGWAADEGVLVLVVWIGGIGAHPISIQTNSGVSRHFVRIL
jgi:hypothetical protein